MGQLKPISMILASFLLVGAVHGNSVRHHDRKEITYTMCLDSSDLMFYYKEGRDIERNKKSEDCERAVAKAQYTNNINTTGWAFMEVEVTDSTLGLGRQGYAAGFIEGRATRHLISLYIKNMIDGYCKEAKEYCNRLYEYLEKNLKWVEDQIGKNQDDPYWQQVALTLWQVRGMADGYDGSLNQGLSGRSLVRHPIYLIQLFGDLLDLEKKFDKPEKKTGVRKGKDHCSALVKILHDSSDILFSHVTWTTYASMLRVQKKYTFAMDGPGKSYSFSGYPGSVASIDDFMVTSSRLAILETTIENHNKRLFDQMKPESVLYFIRSQVATRISSTGKEWSTSFARHNSGTYNNQWVIVDYKKFEKNSHQQPEGLLTVLEQLPGYIRYDDQTALLERRTYWPSYNRPFYTDIFNRSNSQEMVKEFGDWYSYDRAPRARIFKRDHADVVDIDSMTTLMRSNDYKNDPFSRCKCDPPYSAESVISARSELNDPNGTYPIKDQGFMDEGATDLKITSSDLVNSLTYVAIAGPTHGKMPVFDWRTSILRDTVPHHGQPNRWTFEAIQHEWSPLGLFWRD